jgi:predicted alpha/beta superfamily hydrolase
VLYMHDGQNCWDDPVEPFGHGGWCVNLAADRLIDAGAIVPFIGVGVANTPDRLQEYGPGPDIFSADRQPYIRYLVDDVKAEVDRRYRTLTDAAHTALMGSSMGGVISLQAAIVRPDVFGQAACLSSAFIFGDASGHSYFDLIKKLGKQPVRLYLDSGTAGRQQDGAPKTRAMVALLRETGWKEGVDLMHFEDTGAEHNERAWRARVDRPLWFLFGKQPSNKPKSGS